MKRKESVSKLWSTFIAHNPTNSIQDCPPGFYFCDNEKDANECAELVVKGIKQATATSLWWYEKNNEPLPETGDQYIVTDWAGEAKAVIETTRVELTPYHQITPEFASTEGEGDKSLAYWRAVHRAYYTREMSPYGEQFDENMIIVCEYFKTLFVADEVL
jgi:uncharacterized protein YhfF